MKSHILDTVESLDEFTSFVSREWDNIDLVAFDLETDSVEEIKANVYGVGLAFSEDEGFYLPIRAKDGSFFFDAATADKCTEFVTDLLRRKKFIAHNGVYDCLVWQHRYGVGLEANLAADTILMRHCINENGPFGLKDVAVEILGPWADKAQQELYDSIEANGGSTAKSNLQMFMADTAVLGRYCTWDVMLTYKLYNKFKKDIEAQGLVDLLEGEVMPLYREVTIPMKFRGIAVDVPYFEKLKVDIIKEIDIMEENILSQIDDLVRDFCKTKLDTDYGIKKTGTFAKEYAKWCGIETASLARKVIEKMPDDDKHSNFKAWMLEDTPIDPDIAHQVQMLAFFSKNPNQNHVFNLRSKTNLKWLLFEKLGLDPLSTTEGGSPQVDDDFLESISDKYAWVSQLQDLNKLEKLKGTYIEGILDRQVNGVLYTSMLQFGTTSGRYASRNPNMQNAPRPKEDDSGLSEVVLHYNNAIRAGFIARDGNVYVDLDYSALEPRCFAQMSGDKNLQNIFHSGEDMYSSIAKRVYKLDAGTFKSDKDFLGKKYPEMRQSTKQFALATTYGAEAFRIADLLKIDREEAQRIIDDYMSAYPGLKKYISQCHYETNKQGFVKTIFGRVRHLDEAKTIYEEHGHQILNARWAKSKGLGDVRRKYKTLLNNSTNFKIQGLAAHIVNKAMLNITRRLRTENLDGYVCLTVHDQIIVECPESIGESVRQLCQYEAENAVKLDVPLVAEPKIAVNMRDSH